MKDMRFIEEGFLSRIIYEPASIKEASKSIQPSQLIFPEYRAVYKAMLELLKEKKTVADDLLFLKMGKDYHQIIIDLMASYASSGIEHYINEIERNSAERDLRTATASILNREIPIDEKLELINGITRDIAKKRNATPILTIRNSRDIVAKKPHFFLPDKLPIQENEVSMISASGGTGKSWTALWLMFELQIQHGLKVFAFLSEDTLENTKHRIDELCKVHPNFKEEYINYVGKESRPQPIFGYDSNGNLQATEYFYQFKEALKDFDIVILDPLIGFAGGDENNNIEAKFMISLLNEWGAKEDKTFIILHHHGKNDLVRGASAYIDAVRMHYILGHYKDEKSGEVDETKRVAKLDKDNHHRGKKDFIIALFLPEQHRTKEPHKEKTVPEKQRVKEKTSQNPEPKRQKKAPDIAPDEYAEIVSEKIASFDIGKKPSKNIDEHWGENEKKHW